MPMSKIEIINDIVKEQQSRKVSFHADGKQRRVLVDLFTASYIKRAYESFSKENQIKWESLSWPKFLALGIRLMAG